MREKDPHRQSSSVSSSCVSKPVKMLCGFPVLSLSSSCLSLPSDRISSFSLYLHRSFLLLVLRFLLFSLRLSSSPPLLSLCRYTSLSTTLFLSPFLLEVLLNQLRPSRSLFCLSLSLLSLFLSVWFPVSVCLSISRFLLSLSGSFAQGSTSWWIQALPR